MTPGWEDDIVRRQDGCRWRRCQGRRVLTPMEGNHAMGGEGGAGQE